MSRIWIATACLVALGVTPVRAQHTGQYEFTLAGGFVRFDPKLHLTSQPIGIVRLGYMFNAHFGIEGDLAMTQTKSDSFPSVTIQPLIGGGSLVFDVLNSDRNILYILGGYSREDYGAQNPYRFTDGAAHAAVGDRIFLSGSAALRLEARGYMTTGTSHATFAPSRLTNLVVSAGFAFFQQGGPPRPLKDSDGDGVPDKRDACPNTPLGATVDVRGCPMDSDSDGVYDGIDQCPNTPRGAVVDAKGCPSDSDGDGVPDGIDQCPDTPHGAVVDAKGCPIDSDKDGVPDGLDKCPNTPLGATVDVNGCPMDSDGDGVPDGIDQCPGTPHGAVVDAKGCPIDSDGDGVPDGIDKCPNTPPGTKVDATGCPLVPVAPVVGAGDEDGDGVPDSLDRCPHTPPGTKVDAHGCMVLFAPPDSVTAQRTPGARPPRPTLILMGVQFETGRSALRAVSYAVLDQVAASLMANPDIRIEIAGYTDNTGPMPVNIRLSQARAIAVRAYLARKGVTPLRMVARGFGPSGAIATNTTADGRAQNRRVELHKLP